MIRFKTYNKILLFISLYLSVTIFLVGLLPYIKYGHEATFWDSNLILSILSVLIGVTIIISLFVYVIMAIFSAILYRGILRYMRMTQLLFLLFIMAYVSPEASVFSINTSIILFTSFGLVILLLDCFIYFKYQNKLAIDFLGEEERDSVLRSNATNSFDAESLLTICIAIITFSFMVGLEDKVTFYVFLIASNLYLLHKYHINMSKARKEKRRNLIYTIVLLTLSIISYEVFGASFLQDPILSTLFFILPALYLYPSIIKNYYVATWKSRLG